MYLINRNKEINYVTNTNTQIIFKNIANQITK